MYSIDQDIPYGMWQLIIRARTDAELDRAIIIVSGRIASTLASRDLAEEIRAVCVRAVARAAATETIPSSSAPSAERVVGALAELADYEDICPTPYVFPWRHPHGSGAHAGDKAAEPDPSPWDESFDAVALAATRRLAALSEQGMELAESAGRLLDRLAG